MIKQQGITLIGAIFVLIIVSLLGQYLINISAVQRQTSLLALQSARAYQAANAGIEWAIGHTTFCKSDPPFTLNNFNVTVTSVPDDNNPYNEGKKDELGVDINTNICKIKSQAEYGNYGNIDYVSRTLEVTIHD